MPVTLRRLTPDEVAETFPARRAQDVSEYVDVLKGLVVGDVIEVDTREVGERATKRRLTIAAKQLGVRIRYARHSPEQVVQLQLIAVPNAQVP